MVQPTSSGKNIWVAASDGDLERVQYWIEEKGLSPNVKDDNAYTPVHAAASYAHLELLEYLLSNGGDINLPDDEGETPLYTVESVDTAQWLIQHGADPAHVNSEGQTAADFLEEDHPEVAEYLRSLLPNSHASDPASAPTHLVSHASAPGAVSALALDSFASNQTSGLLEESRRIMEQSERDGTDPEARLRELVERAVSEGISFGGQLGDQITAAVSERRPGRDGPVLESRSDQDARDAGVKRPRAENGE